MSPTLTVHVADSVGNETVATHPFQAGGETIIPINVPTDGTDATAALQAALSGLPNGTSANRTVGLLPSGTITLVVPISSTAGLALSNKQWVELRGQDTKLYWPDYGPQFNNLWQRRHLVVDKCHNTILRGIHVAGPHTVRDPGWSARSLYMPSKAFQHGFQVTTCTNLTMIDCSVYEIAGDGLYLNAVDDLVVDGFRVQYNGRQGVAGIDGQRWLFNNLNVINSARGSIDWEPIGTVSGRIRWISDTEIRNSFLKGVFGVILHRCSSQWLHNNVIEDGIRLEDRDTDTRTRRTIRINDNDFKKWTVTTGNWPVISVDGFKELVVTGNRVERNLANPASNQSPFVRLWDPLTSGASITVRDNVVLDFVTAIAPSTSISGTTLDTLVAACTWDVGNNDLGHGVIQGKPPWLASRTGGG